MTCILITKKRITPPLYISNNSLTNIMQPMKVLKGMLAVFWVLSVIACTEKDESEQTYDPSSPIALESYYPHEGGVGTQLIIRGGNFGYDASKVSVWIDNDESKKARVVSARGNRIYAIVPARAGSGKVTVSIADDEGKEQTVRFDDEFTYEYHRNLSTVAGNGTMEDVDGNFKDARFISPTRLALDDENNLLFVLETEAGKALRVMDLENETVSTPWRGAGLHNLRTLCMASTMDTLIVGVEGGSANVSTVYLLRSDGFLRHKTYAPQAGSNCSIVNPRDGTLFINNYYDGYIYRYDRDKNEMVKMVKCMNEYSDFFMTFSQDGEYMLALALDGSTSSCVYRMKYNYEDRTLDEPIPWAGMPGVNAWADGVGQEALLNQPYQINYGGPNEYFIADTWNHCVRRIRDINGEANVETCAGVPGQTGFSEGEPLEALLRFPTGVAATRDGSVVYVADKDNARIVKVTVE